MGSTATYFMFFAHQPRSSLHVPKIFLDFELILTLVVAPKDLLGESVFLSLSCLFYIGVLD
jgi:hypothetical protein